MKSNESGRTIVLENQVVGLPESDYRILLSQWHSAILLRYSSREQGAIVVLLIHCHRYGNSPNHRHMKKLHYITIQESDKLELVFFEIIQLCSLRLQVHVYRVVPLGYSIFMHQCKELSLFQIFLKNIPFILHTYRHIYVLLFLI